MYRPDPISSSPRRDRSPSNDDLPTAYVTQPTQPLGTRSPFFAVPAETQPTQPLTPRTNRLYQPTSSQLQVPRSSPGAERFSSPAMAHSHPQSQRFNPMAPPGTQFLPPVPVARQPVYDLTSDDPPVERDPFEDDEQYNTHVPLSKVELSSRTSRVEETPQKAPSKLKWDLSAYEYNAPAKAADTNQRKRPSAGLNANSPPSKKPKIAHRQGGPSRAMPVDLTGDDSAMTLDDIADPGLRKKTERIMAVYTSRSVKQIFDALTLKRGHHDDTLDYLATVESDDELMKSPQFFPSKVEPVAKKTAQRTLQAPVESLLNKYNKFSAPQASSTTATSPEDDQPKPKRRLVRGRRNPSPSSPAVTPQRPQTQQQKRPKVAESDEEDIDEGIVEISDDDSDAEGSVVEHTFSETKLLDFFNKCTVEAMVDLSNHKENEIREILDQRPFASMDAVRALHLEAKKPLKDGKKARKPRITFGDRLVDSAEEMWDAYSTIDSVVKKCEEKGRPMIAGMSRWGIDVFGASTEDGIDATTLDDGSDTSSSRDSGYHTPRSDAGTSDVRKNKRAKLLKQPVIMNKGVELKDYQVVGLNWLNLLWQNKISGILADDMGLGKTCQIIAFLSHLKEQGTSGDQPTLIFVPGSTLENWCREFVRFSDKIKFTPYYGPQKERWEYQDTILDNISRGECDVIITTYDLTIRTEDSRFMKKCRPKMCIFDEGHVLKNADTARYKALMKINTECRILLTGTPLQNSLQELMSILGFLMPDVFRDPKEAAIPVADQLKVLFKHKAKVAEVDSHSTLLSAQRIQRARTMLMPFILRRKKAQVLKHLPKKTSRVEYCELTKTQKELYEEQLEKQRKVIQDRQAGILVKDHANVMMKLRQAAIHPLLFRHRYTDAKLQKIAKACIKEEKFAASDPAIIFEEMQLYQDYQCHDLARKYPGALKKFQLQDREWMDSGKVKKLLELLKKYKENGDRALVFSQFTSVMDILGWVFDDADIAFMRMDGNTPIAERQTLMDTFYADTSIGVFMISTKSGGAGINLACANKVVIFDSSFNPQDDIQAENRAHRVGQTREVEVVRLVTQGTVEEQIYALGVSKLELDKMIQGEEGEGGKKKKDEVDAEAAGINAVEQMLAQQLVGGKEEKKEEKDVKEQFKNGLKEAGLNIAE